MAGESASFDDQDDVYASFIEIHEHGGEKLSEEIAGMIEHLDPLPASSPKHCCIYKVSDHIRKSNNKAYTPQVISIGPFYLGHPKLQKMDRFKLGYLKSFSDRAETKLEDIVSAIKVSEDCVRECYSETIKLRSEEFVKMVLLDASFIIEYFWKSKTKGNWTEYEGEILKPWLWNRMQMDLILLENQLPFFIIEKIYVTAFPSLSEKLPFIELSFCQFDNYNVQKFVPDQLSGIFILHFTDLVRNFCMPPPERRPQRSYRSMKEMYSLAELVEVGLKFKKREPSNINWSPLELKYADGVLEIPPFQLDSTTEIYARNLVAFEQFHDHGDPYITNYYFLLRLLIRSRKDVFFLVHKEILKLVDCVDDMDAISMLNKMLENIDGLGMNNCYSQLAEESNKFFKARVTYLQIMMAILKRDYFSTPWKGAATIGGILLLLLTIIQTVCALISVKN